MAKIIFLVMHCCQSFICSRNCVDFRQTEASASFRQHHTAHRKTVGAHSCPRTISTNRKMLSISLWRLRYTATSPQIAHAATHTYTEKLFFFLGLYFHSFRGESHYRFFRPFISTVGKCMCVCERTLRVLPLILGLCACYRKCARI